MPPHLAGAPIATTHTPQAQPGHPTCVNRSLKWRPSASYVTPQYSRIWSCDVCGCSRRLCPLLVAAASVACLPALLCSWSDECRQSESCFSMSESRASALSARASAALRAACSAGSSDTGTDPSPAVDLLKQEQRKVSQLCTALGATFLLLLLSVGSNLLGSYFEVEHAKSMTIRTPSTTGYSKLVDKTTGAPLAASKQTSAIATKSTSATVAVCMAGAARTVVHPVVIHTHRHHLLKPLKADLFAAVSLAKDTGHSKLSKNPESELRSRGTERWRVQEALQLLGAIEVRYVVDEDAKPPTQACVGSKGASTWPHMFWSVEMCGEVLRAHEDARDQPYEWVVRTRPDTFFRSPINPLPRTAPHPASFYCGRNNDAFFVAAPLAAQGLLSIYGQIAFRPGCRLAGNTSFARTLPWQVQCGLRGLARVRGLARDKGFIYADCLMNLAIHAHRLRSVGCAAELGTIGRDFFRAYYCDMTNRTEPCVTSGWSTRAPAIYFPVPAHEQPSDHGNMTLDHDIYKWGVATGAIIRAAGQ